MSLFSSIGHAISSTWKAVKGVALPAIGMAVGGPVGGVVGGILGGSGGGGAPPVITGGTAGAGGLGGALRAVGSSNLAKLGAAAGAGAVVGHVLSNGTVVKARRRRRKGITARDLNSFRRVARLVDHYAKPVHHMRNIRKRH